MTSMTLILPILATIICAFVNFLRIKATYGKVTNINKVITVSLGICFYLFCLDLSFSNSYDITPLKSVVYAAYYVCIRLAFYNPFLNLMRGLDIFYRSETTNSVIDRLLDKYGITPLFVLILSTFLSFFFAYWFITIKNA